MRLEDFKKAEELIQKIARMEKINVRAELPVEAFDEIVTSEFKIIIEEMNLHGQALLQARIDALRKELEAL